MPQTCSICANVERLAEINKALLVGGRSLRDVSQSFCVAFASLARHSRNCLGRKFAEQKVPSRPRAHKTAPASPAPSRITESDPIDEMDSDLRQTAENARRDGDHRLAVQADALRMRLIEMRERMRERAKTADDAVRRLAMEKLAALPDWFVMAMREGDANALSAIENAISLAQERAQVAEPTDTVAD